MVSPSWGQPTCPRPWLTTPARCMPETSAAFLHNLVKDGQLDLNLEDEIIRDTLLTHQGEVVNPQVRELLDQPAAAPANDERKNNLMEVFVAALTIFVLALFVGFEVITKVPLSFAHPSHVGGQRHFRHHPGGDLGHLGCPIDHLYHDSRPSWRWPWQPPTWWGDFWSPTACWECFDGRTRKYQKCPQN